MDPELKAALRGLKPGSKEYQAALKKYTTDKAAREENAAAASALRQRGSEDAAAKRKREDDDAGAERSRKERAEKDERDRLTGIVTAGSVATGLGSGLVGAKYADKVASKAADDVLAARGEGVTRLAKAARAINPQSPNATGLYRDIGTAADKSGVLNPRVSPYGTSLIGGGLLAGGAYSSFDRAPQAKSDIERAIWTGTGYGEMSAGAKMLADSIRRFANPTRTLPTDDVAAIEGARRIGASGKTSALTPGAGAPGFGQAPATPPPAKPGPNLGTKADLYQQAKARNLKVTSRMTKGEIASTLATAIRKQGGKAVSDAPKALIPAAVGYGVFDALRSPAQAGEGGEASAPMSAPGAAAVGAGAAGATGLGIEGARRLAQGPLGQAMMKGIGRVAGPVGAAMTAYDVGRGAYDEAVKPDSLINGPETGAMPQTPGNPGFMAQQQAAARSAYGQPPELASAQSLHVPEMPADDGGFDQLIAASQDDPELAQMLRDAILARVQQSNEQQIPNAMASQAVSSQGDPMASALRNMAMR